MNTQAITINFDLIAKEIEADPVAAYNRVSGAEWGAGLQKWVPAHMRSGVARYVIFGILPGAFLRAVLENDLMEAGRKGDQENRQRLFDYVMFLINYAPGGCFGSPEAMHAWARKGGVMGPRASGGDPC